MRRMPFPPFEPATLLHACSTSNRSLLQLAALASAKPRRLQLAHPCSAVATASRPPLVPGCGPSPTTEVREGGRISSEMAVHEASGKLRAAGSRVLVGGCCSRII